MSCKRPLPVMDSGNIGSCPHGLEFLGVFFISDILSFVHFKEEMGSVSDDTGRTISRKKYSSGIAKLNGIPQFSRPLSSETSIIQPFFETGHRNDCLRLESRRALNQIPGFGHVKRQEQKFELGGKLILAALPGNFDAESEPLPTVDAVQHGDCYFSLIRTQCVHIE